MTTEEAIRILDPETRREALREIPVLDRIDVDQEACRLAIAALRAQQEEGKNNNVPTRWIPVEERLPDKNEIVLFYANTNGAVYRGKYAFTGKRGAVCFSVRGEKGRETVYSGITHWMPLPLPPKEEV